MSSGAEWGGGGGGGGAAHRLPNKLRLVTLNHFVAGCGHALLGDGHVQVLDAVALRELRRGSKGGR